VWCQRTAEPLRGQYWNCDGQFVCKDKVAGVVIVDGEVVAVGVASLFNRNIASDFVDNFDDGNESPVNGAALTAGRSKPKTNITLELLLWKRVTVRTKRYK
jgi:hypothetical protein